MANQLDIAKNENVMIKKVESRNYSTMHIVLFIIVFMDVGWMSEWTTRKKVNNEHVRGVNE